MKRHEYLQSLIDNARRNLAKPNVRYENGRMSHDVEREVMGDAQEELWDLQLEGRFYADGRFAGYAEDFE